MRLLCLLILMKRSCDAEASSSSQSSQDKRQALRAELFADSRGTKASIAKTLQTLQKKRIPQWSWIGQREWAPKVDWGCSGACQSEDPLWPYCSNHGYDRWKAIQLGIHFPNGFHMVFVLTVRSIRRPYAELTRKGCRLSFIGALWRRCYTWEPTSTWSRKKSIHILLFIYGVPTLDVAFARWVVLFWVLEDSSYWQNCWWCWLRVRFDIEIVVWFIIKCQVLVKLGKAIFFSN